MNTVLVKFSNPKYNYYTSVNPKSTERELRAYFVGSSFNLGQYPVEDMQRCIDIELTVTGEDKFPVFKSHNNVTCWHCNQQNIPGKPKDSGFAPRCGQWEKKCSNCGLFIYYDIDLEK